MDVIGRVEPGVETESDKGVKAEEAQVSREIGHR